MVSLFGTPANLPIFIYLLDMKKFVKKYWEGALVAQIGLAYMLYEYYINGQISSVGISFFAIGNLIVLGKAFFKK